LNDIYLKRKFTDFERREKIFDGNILFNDSTPNTIALCEYAKKLMNEAFNGQDPQKAQFNMKVEDFVSIVGPLKSKFTNDEHTKVLLRNVFSEYGCDLDKTYFDVPRLRVVTHGGYLEAGVGYAYKAHRDTWYGSPHSQVNWWMPVFDLELTQPMTLYTKFWDQPCKNSSAEFDYEEWCNVGRKMAMTQIKKDTRKHPIPLEELDSNDGIRVVTNSAEPVIFSSAHLHATTPNNSGVTRFSIDWRTFHYDDIISKRGAHNVDSKSSGSTLGECFLASDFSPIPKELIY